MDPQVSWLHQKPADKDLHFFQMRVWKFCFGVELITPGSAIGLTTNCATGLV